MKKGFTLVELIVVIVLLSLITIFTFPSINKTIQNRKEAMYNIQVNNIKASAEKYISKNNLLNENDKIIVTLCQLKQEGFEDEKLRDPKTGAYFPDDSKIFVTKGIEGNEYKFEYGSDNMQACTKDYKISIEYVELGSEYNPEYDDSYTVNIYKGNSKVEKVDTSTIGTYFIEYISNSKSYSKYVYVIDTTNPVIKYKNEQEFYDENNNLKQSNEIGEGTIKITASKNEVFYPFEVEVTDNAKYTLTVSSNVNLKLPGSYYVVYKAVDEHGNSTSKTQTIIVEDKIKPEIDEILGLPDKKTSSSLIISVVAHDNESGLHPRGAYSFDGGTTWQTDNSITIDKNKTLNIVVRDAALNETKKDIVIDNILKDDKNISYTINKGTLKNNGWFVDDVEILVKPLVSTEYFENLTYWITENTNTTPDNTETISNIESTSISLNENTNGKYICGFVTKKDGSKTDIICSMIIKIDKEAPTCEITIEEIGASGISGYMTIKDTGFSGPEKEKIIFKNLKSTKNENIYDKAGNKNICSVKVKKTDYTSTCSKYKACATEACGWGQCVTGENTCKYGCDWCEDYTPDPEPSNPSGGSSGSSGNKGNGSSGNKGNSSGGNKKPHGGGGSACPGHVPCTTTHMMSNTNEFVYDCNCSSCYYGHNSCKSGYYTCRTKKCGCETWTDWTIGTCTSSDCRSKTEYSYEG